MKDQSFTEEVMKILDEAPHARRTLKENYDNLINVADYCCNNYIQAGDSSIKALEETKHFATQSLASVAYQISTLANSVLSLLDAQTNQLRQMESSIHLIGQTVEMHKEKVSRREIGAFTAVRRVPRCHKILPPSSSQPRPPYSRRPINFQQLDGVGHGVKISGKQAERTGTIRKPGSSIRSNKPLEAVQCPVAPPAGSSSFGKPVAPPSLPPTWQAPPECDIVTTLLDDVPPPPPAAEEVNEEFPSSVLPLKSAGGSDIAPPPPPASEALTNHIAPPVAPPAAPPLTLETVVEETALPSPSPPPPPPPPPSDDDGVPPLPSDGADLLAPPSPPPFSQDVEDLEIPAPPPPLLLDDGTMFDDIMPPLPPPVDYDTSAPPQYLDKVVALYTYEASKPGDLSFAEGATIYLTRRLDDGWCEGVANGDRGLFPENLVQSCG